MNNTDLNIFSPIVAIPLILAVLVIARVLYFLFKRNKHSGTHVDASIYQENAYKQLPEAIVILNAKDQLIYLNLQAENMLSNKLRSVMGKPYSDVFTLLDKETRRPVPIVFDTRNSRDKIKRNYLLSTQTNKELMIELHLIESINERAKDGRKVLLLKDTTERRALESKLSNLETYDALTRMLNRKPFDGQVKQLVDNAHKHNSNHLLAFFSIDQFQIVNDTIGYTGGESLVSNVADIIKSYTTNSIDIVGRISVNEFAVVFSERKLPDAVRAIQGIVKSISEYKFMSLGQQYSITMSAGFVVIDVNTTSSTRAITEASIACNLASKQGGNQTCVYRQENSEIKKLEGNLEWVLILKKALQENKFRLHAQAIQPLALEKYKKPFHHYELLLRLSDDMGNPISPDEFITAAEYYSMMPAIDRWVVKNAIERIAKIEEQTPLPVFAINLSGQSLNDAQFLSDVKKELTESKVNPEMLCFEITEQVAVEDLASLNNFIASLKALGCKFSLDDFGTGVSSYSYLRSLDVDYLKIDGSFVKHIVNDDVAKTMVQSINQVGHTMNLQIIAEYVENNEIVEILREMGVDYGQGWEIAKPIPIEDVIKTHTEQSDKSFVTIA